jgi:hypothetical protein
VRRRSPNSLFHHGFATFGEDAVYDHKHSEGFIRLFSLPLRIRALLGLNPDAKKIAADNPSSGTASNAAAASTSKQKVH